jgi:uncharacterized membrane protein YeaQ/YmgE (transglycosylase-associated protein family)
VQDAGWLGIGVPGIAAHAAGRSAKWFPRAGSDDSFGEITWMQFLWFILIGIAAGWLAGQVMKGGGCGLVGDLIVGVIGALLGGFLFGLLGISAGGLLGSLVTATVGSIVLVVLRRAIKKRSSRTRPISRDTSSPRAI